jgi:hypothetical protein
LRQQHGQAEVWHRHQVIADAAGVLRGQRRAQMQ